MRQSFHRPRGAALLLLLVFILSIHITRSVASRLLQPPERENLKNGQIQKSFRGGELEENDFWQPMGAEESCEDGNDECVQRRMTYEAHLDYIYTQSHKP